MLDANYHINHSHQSISRYLEALARPIFFFDVLVKTLNITISQGIPLFFELIIQILVFT